MQGPREFSKWLSGNIANDKKWGRKVFRYHPRSDEHSKTICELVFADLMEACPDLAEHVLSGRVVGRTNTSYRFPSGKVKTIDLGVGTPAGPSPGRPTSKVLAGGELAELRIACEAKQCMTEHSKSQPRIYDELSSSHEIVHQGDRRAIACGIVVVNIARTFASPLRQTSGDGPLVVTAHRQPIVAASMIKHLRGLKTREKVDEVGFDAFATVVIDCDNVGTCRLHTDAPAPQPGDSDHYETFIQRISRAYSERYRGP